MITPNELYEEDIKKITEIYGIKDVDLDDKDYEKIIESRIDASMKYHHGSNVYEEAIIYHALPISYIDRVVSKYTANGWNYVYVSIYDGITSFKFSNNEIVWLNKPHKIYTDKSAEEFLSKFSSMINDYGVN